MYYDTGHAVLDYGHNPRLQIWIAKKKDGDKPRDIKNQKKINVLSRCTMILGMLSWTMATIQDYRSGLKKRGQQAQRHLRFSKLIYNMCFWTLGMLAWSTSCRLQEQMDKWSVAETTWPVKGQHNTCLFTANTKLAAPWGLPRRSPTPVLTRPYAA